MTITGTSYFFDRARDRMGALSQTADTLQSQIATGKKLVQPSQDSAAWQRLQTLVRAKADGGAYASNITLAKSVLQETDTALGSLQSAIQRASELTIQANTGALSAGNRRVIAEQLEVLVGEIAEIGALVDTRGERLFTDTAAAIPIADGLSVQPNVDGGALIGNIQATLGTYIAQLRSGDDASVAASSATALASIAAVQDAVTSARGSIGARAARVELCAATAQDAVAIVEQQRSAIEDTDLTATIADLQKAMTVLEATQASFTKLTQLSLFNFLR